MLRLTVTGNATADAELHFTPAGRAVANFTVASNTRYLDREASEWKDGPTTFVRVAVWGPLAENVADSVTKGTAVTVTGDRLEAKAYSDRQGEAQANLELTAREVAVSLSGQTTQVSKAKRQADEPDSDS